MKIILPVAGTGTRLRPHTLHLPKCLLPVAGSTILGHILSGLRHLEASEYIFVTGYMADKVEEHIRERYGWLPARFVRQDHPQGLGEAIHLCAPWLGNEPVLIVLGDTLFDADLDSICKSPANVLCTRKVEDPSRFGVAVSDSEGRIQRLVEKPSTFVSDQALVGIYWIREAQILVQALSRLVRDNIRTRGEYQLTDALQDMIIHGHTFLSGEIRNWLDCGKPETLLETNRLLLDRLQPLVSAKYPGTTVIPPCSIAPDAVLEDCVIGPHVSISDGCRLLRCRISDSVIDGGCLLEDCHLENSILGKGITARKFHGKLDAGESSNILCG